MSSLPRLFIVISLLALTSCGFRPMHGEDSRQAFSGGVLIETPNDRMGQQFRQDLEDRLNPNGVVPPRPAYKLSVTLNAAASAIGVARDGTVSRFNVTLGSSFQLKRIADGKVIKTGNVQHVSSYNNQVNQYYSTYISEKDAISRGITELAELYRQRIGLVLLKGK